ncbi:hypothetical protein PF005_g20373 [Phytophthora fragariae]|uniref:Uncharacterized protein n=1 Tax=Phytophthora fragariae TaxID=53985 RepID=A0A6A3WTB0_9STRA|nr:hypothetical protein PF011_g17559 [Phytophthora fragariae]KAE9086218.1 hypothetical protein PF007_g20860 [Phytophthora fragariae]KAE9090749.1 hypothetical protein PF010_g18468 [Phytophthora fragariae]KAE9187634.1 hypothetical protein PF005_g20373 [Phytophthora fragariae]KAE9205145.1 hypothetical protein PF004_g17644 [Phytophthora fragariae]
MKDEDGELHNVMLFAAKDDPNRYPMWITGSFSGGGCGVETDTEAGLFTPLMPLLGKGDWIVSCADGSA